MSSQGRSVLLQNRFILPQNVPDKRQSTAANGRIGKNRSPRRRVVRSGAESFVFRVWDDPWRGVAGHQRSLNSKRARLKLNERALAAIKCVVVLLSCWCGA